MLKFSEMLQEAIEPSFISEAELNEAQENLRATMDKHFISVVKINGKAIDKLVSSSPRKVLVTTDGKWTIVYTGHGNDTDRSHFRINNSSNFYKNGSSESYTFWGEKGTISAFKEAFESTSSIEEAIKKMPELVDGYYIQFQERTESNKHKDKLNPYSLIKAVKPYSKALPTSEEEAEKAKLRKDDVVKMVLSGQIERIEISGKYSDDYAADAERGFSKGKQLDAIEFLKDYLGMDKPFVYFKQKNGEVIIHISYARFYYIDLIPNKSKFKK